MVKKIEIERRFIVKPRKELVEKLDYTAPIHVIVHAPVMALYCLYEKQKGSETTWLLRRKTGMGMIREEEEYEISAELAADLLWDDKTATLEFDCWILSDKTCLKRIRLNAENDEQKCVYIYEEHVESTKHVDYYLDPFIEIFGDRWDSDKAFLMADDVTDSNFDIRTIAMYNNFDFYIIKE